ncbi:hypothetical protein F2Q70_00005304 [Brassica cretica]|uniref:NYN domain-containing protein n=1 Tax=Brassica cretica TaxID=69181 RepID=A0A8S9IP52_BRACR|nr:hypothetical protein F2Q70_00005304 [Brassica cretica]
MEFPKPCFLFFQENHVECPLTCHPSCKDKKTIFYWDSENAPIPFDMKRDDLIKMFRSNLIRFGVFVGDAADYELLKVLKEDDRRSKYKNNVVIVGGDHLHVKSLSGISCSFLLLASKQEKIQFDRAKRIASGKMDSYRDGQRAKKGRKEQGRKARKQEQKLDEAETDFEMGMEAEVVLNINQEVV